jgi:hypothetical protein
MKLTPASIAAWIVSRPSSLSEAPADGKGGRQPGGQRFLTQARVAHHKTPRGLQKGVEVVVSLSLARASLQLATGDRSRVSCWQKGRRRTHGPEADDADLVTVEVDLPHARMRFSSRRLPWGLAVDGRFR